MSDLKTVNLTLPATTGDLRELEIGSVAYLSGRLFTGREGGASSNRPALGRCSLDCRVCVYWIIRIRGR